MCIQVCICSYKKDGCLKHVYFIAGLLCFCFAMTQSFILFFYLPVCNWYTNFSSSENLKDFMRYFSLLPLFKIWSLFLDFMWFFLPSSVESPVAIIYTAHVLTNDPTKPCTWQILLGGFIGTILATYIDILILQVISIFLPKCMF